MIALVTLFRDAIAKWWIDAPITRKLGDIAIAWILCVIWASGYVVWQYREPIEKIVMAYSGPELDHVRAQREVTAFLASVTSKGVDGVFILDVDVRTNRRSVIAYAADPEVATEMRRRADEAREVPLLGGGQYTLDEVRQLIAGTPFWSPAVNGTGRLRYVVPVPPLRYGSEVVGMVLLISNPDIEASQRLAIEGLAIRWAARLSR